MEQVVQGLRRSFQTHKTRPFEWRKAQLLSVQKLIDENKKEICEALRQDLNKPEQETIIMEIGMVQNSITYILKNLHQWMQPQKVNPIIQARALYSFYTQHEPLGVVLIIAPWNYPFQLTFVPLVGALAAGNCALVKPSELSVRTSELLERLWPKYFDTNFVSLINGDATVSTELLKNRYFLFFYSADNYPTKN